MTSDPVTIVCVERFDRWGAEEREQVREELRAVVAAGWRIVRTETVTRTFGSAGASLVTQDEIAEEWTPDA